METQANHMGHCFTPIRMVPLKHTQQLSMTRAGTAVEKQAPWHPAGGSINGAGTVENSKETP